jgi:hypothetical protein
MQAVIVMLEKGEKKDSALTQFPSRHQLFETPLFDQWELRDASNTPVIHSIEILEGLSFNFQHIHGMTDKVWSQFLPARC